MDDAAWLALTVALTLVGAIFTLFAFRQRGATAGIRALAWTLLPVACYLTKTTETLVEIAGSVADWATGLVFSPVVWTGIALFAVSALLFVVSGGLRLRLLDAGRAARGGAEPSRNTKQTKRGNTDNDSTKSPRPSTAPADEGDDQLDDVEEILRRRGIT